MYKPNWQKLKSREPVRYIIKARIQRVSLETATQQQSNLAERLQNKPFWI
jgi:hypothetical protein